MTPDFATKPHSKIAGEQADRLKRASFTEPARPPSSRPFGLEAILALQRSAGNRAVKSMLSGRHGAIGLGGREGVLALQAGAGNRAVGRALTSQVRVARAPLRSTPDVIHPDAMKFLAEKLRQLYAAIPRADRIQLNARGTVAIGMATVDGTTRLVYTVNNNGGSAPFHAAAERLDLHRWIYDSGVKGRGAVGAPNDAEQLMMGFSKDNRAPLHGIVVSRTPCRDCATVIPAYGGGRLRVEHIPDPADLPNPRNPPSRLNPPAQTVHGEIDTKKPPGAPPGRTLSGPTKPPDLPPGSVFARNRPVFEQIDKPIIALPKTAPAQPPPTSPATTSTTTTTTTATKAAPTRTTPSSTPPPLGTVRSVLVPTAMRGTNFLAGLAISWYANEMFKRDWAAAMTGVEKWLQMYLPSYRPSFAPGKPLYAIVQVELGSGGMHMGPGGGWTGTASTVKVEQIQVADYPMVPPMGFSWVEKSPWWTMLLGFTYTSTHVRFSFPLPVPHDPPGPDRVLIDAGPQQRTPIRSGGGPGT